jgi:hypothetical protein
VTPPGDRSALPPLSRDDLLPLGALTLLGALLRGGFLALMGTPPYDPWRHLLLLQNLRSGAGFTLFEGQPYLWYSPLWYRLCALFPEAVGPQWIAGMLSLFAVPAIYVLLRGHAGESSRRVAVAGALLTALCGPLITFTCHYGPEALAVALTLGALLLAYRGRGIPSGLIAGLAFGLALVARLNFAMNIFLFLPLLRERRRGVSLLPGIALPLLATWWRNHRIIEAHPWVFTWDGLATRSADFDLLSTLVIQLHPAVQEGLRRLHDLILPWPEWIVGPTGPAWGKILFMLCGLGCLVASRRPALILTGVATMSYFLLFDSTRSSHFFRIYLTLFPAFILGAALTAGALWRRGQRWSPWLGWLPVLLMIVGGAGMLRPTAGLALERVTPPKGLLTEEAYLVNSGFYHPESLIYRYPEKRFIGMPLRPEELEEIESAFPDYRHVLWHDFSIQDELGLGLRDGERYRPLRSGTNVYGRRYVVLGRSR